MAVGAISDLDHVDGMITAGRADLSAMGRPHLADLAWAPTEAAKIDAIDWPRQSFSGKSQMKTLFAPEQAARAAQAPGATEKEAIR